MAFIHTYMVAAAQPSPGFSAASSSRPYWASEERRGHYWPFQLWRHRCRSLNLVLFYDHRFPLVARWVSIYGFRIVWCMYGVFMILYRIIPCHACIWVCMYVGRIFLISHLSYHVYVSVLCVVCGACCGARLSRDRRGDGWCRMAILRLTWPGNIIRKRRPPSSRTGGHPRSGRHTAISSLLYTYNNKKYIYMYMYVRSY